MLLKKDIIKKKMYFFENEVKLSLPFELTLKQSRDKK